MSGLRMDCDFLKDRRTSLGMDAVIITYKSTNIVTTIARFAHVTILLILS
jgi:NADH:ubiquinone oxidoreductase subunit F (NADH-binding)